MKIYLPIIILWSIITAFSVKAHGAVFAFVAVPFVVIYLAACLYYLLSKKRPAKELGLKLSVIAFSYLVIAVVHVVRFQDARSNADQGAARVLAFKASHGRFPESSLEAGVPDREFGRGRLFYKNTPEGPVLFYPATQVPFDTYSFNFKEAEWEYQSD